MTSPILSKEQSIIQHEIRKFVKTIIEPIERDLDKRDADLKSIYKQVVELGFAGALIPEQYDGAGLDMISFCIVLEEIARSCASLSLILLVNNMIGELILNSDHQEKQTLLKNLAHGAVGGFVIPPIFDEHIPSFKELDNKILIDSTESQLILNGDKPEFLLAPIIYTDRIVIYLLKPTDKIKYLPLSTMGLKIAGIHAIRIAGFELSQQQELLSFKNKSDYHKNLNNFRVGLAAIGVGIAGAAFDTSFRYAQERKQFERKIIEFPMVQDMLVTMKTQTEAARHMTYNAAAQYKNDGTLPLMARLLSTETAVYCGKQAVQILGGYGYIKDYSAERYLRDAKTLQLILESPFAVKDMLVKELL